MTLLSIQNLHVHFFSRGLDNRQHVARALNGVNLDLQAGKIMGLAGETGAGKSLTAYATIGLLRGAARIVGGKILFNDRNLVDMPEPELARLRGSRLGLVVQNPKNSLDPLTRVGDQLIRVRRAHTRDSASAARQRAKEIMEAVGIPDAKRMDAYPHEFSGGMAQRVAIALALINEPALLIADEPTTGLDVTVQAQILDLMQKLVRERNMALLIITHDLGIVAQYCDSVAVMFAGGVVETGPVSLLSKPVHPYTSALIASTPERRRPGRSAGFGGTPPNLYDLPEGCHYRLRCPLALPVCGQPPSAFRQGPEHEVLCHRASEIVNEQVKA